MSNILVSFIVCDKIPNSSVVTEQAITLLLSSGVGK